MRCCDRCATALDRSYRVDGDGDGVEFLTETVRTATGEESATVLLR